MDGGREGIRTPDPLLAKQVLSQLSYTPNAVWINFRVFSKSVHLHFWQTRATIAAHRSVLPVLRLEFLQFALVFQITLAVCDPRWRLLTFQIVPEPGEDAAFDNSVMRTDGRTINKASSRAEESAHGEIQ
jgi:hypothetical protein